MLIKQLSIVAAAAVTLSCAQNRIATVHTTTPPAFQRQVQNAIDAGDGDVQLKMLRQRAATDPDNLQVRMELGDAYLVRGYPDVALEHFRLAAARFPDAAPPQLAIAKSLRAQNLRAAAAAGLEAFLKKHPDVGAEYHSWLGILRDEAGLWPAGEAAHRMALERNPKADYLHNNLGYNLLKQGKDAAAAEEIRAALKLNPNSAVARNNLGLALATTGGSDQALKNWQSAGDPATAHSNLAAVLIEQGKYPEARKELDIALGYNRAHPAALRNLELLSRLEGTPATLRSQSMDSRWSRWKSSVRRLFVGPLEESPKPAAKTAS